MLFAKSFADCLQHLLEVVLLLLLVSITNRTMVTDLVIPQIPVGFIGTHYKIVSGVNIEITFTDIICT